jgi:hypothetical protein
MLTNAKQRHQRTFRLSSVSVSVCCLAPVIYRDSGNNDTLVIARTFERIEEFMVFDVYMYIVARTETSWVSFNLTTYTMSLQP